MDSAMNQLPLSPLVNTSKLSRTGGKVMLTHDLTLEEVVNVKDPETGQFLWRNKGLLRHFKRKYGYALFEKDELGFYQCFFKNCKKKMKGNFSRHLARHEMMGDEADPRVVKDITENRIRLPGYREPSAQELAIVDDIPPDLRTWAIDLARKFKNDPEDSQSKRKLATPQKSSIAEEMSNTRLPTLTPITSISQSSYTSPLVNAAPINIPYRPSARQTAQQLQKLKSIPISRLSQHDICAHIMEVIKMSLREQPIASDGMRKVIMQVLGIIDLTLSKTIFKKVEDFRKYLGQLINNTLVSLSSVSEPTGEDIASIREFNKLCFRVFEEELQRADFETCRDFLLNCAVCRAEPGKRGLLHCAGSCVRAFHLQCVGMKSAPTLPYFCWECQQNRSVMRWDDERKQFFYFSFETDNNIPQRTFPEKLERIDPPPQMPPDSRSEIITDRYAIHRELNNGMRRSYDSPDDEEYDSMEEQQKEEEEVISALTQLKKKDLQKYRSEDSTEIINGSMVFNRCWGFYRPADNNVKRFRENKIQALLNEDTDESSLEQKRKRV